MIPFNELLPATQHYSLLAIATALYTVAVASGRRTTSKLFWICLAVTGMVPILYIVVPALCWMSRPSSLSWATSSPLAHGIAVALLVPVATYFALEFRSRKGRRKPRLEPRVSNPSAGESAPH